MRRLNIVVDVVNLQIRFYLSRIDPIAIDAQMETNVAILGMRTSSPVDDLVDVALRLDVEGPGRGG